MKTESIIFRADPRIAALLRETATATDRTMTDLITSGLRFYLEAGPGEYPDNPEPGPMPLPIYFMLSNPDAHFYNVGVGENTVSGLFEGTARDFGGNWNTMTGIEWEISLETFFDACYRVGVIADHNDAYVWLSDACDAKQYPRLQWATDWLTENVATETFYKVLAAAYRTEFSNDLSVIAYRLAEFHGNPARLWDVDLKTAVLELAGLFRACSEWPMQGV